MPRLFIISGCNGAGKTTASYTLLPEMLECSQYVNSDEFAKGLSPFDPGSVSVQASRLMLLRIRYLFRKKEDFSIETTLATRSLLKMITDAQNDGYTVTLLYFWLNSPDLAVERVKARVAAGGHNILLIGAPGSGKSMLAKRLPSILPPLSLGESLETTKIHSVAGKIGSEGGLITRRPFRSPHHTISTAAMTGGGSFPQPGEISLAHNGVLFLDELPEFNRNVLEVLRQPLEDRKITISRVRSNIEYPASFTLVASMNPCPCGYYNHPTKPCVCTPNQVQKYLNRISGPLLDRIDLQIEVIPVPFEKMSDARPGEPSAVIRQRVMNARRIQEERYAGINGVYCNAQMSSRLLAEYARPDERGLALLKTAMNRLNLSARAYDRILKVARTIADLEGSEHVQSHHLAEAIGYRNLDREDWAG